MDQQTIKKKDIDIEIDLLKSMSNKSNFNTYIDTIDLKRVYPSTKLLLNDFSKYFDVYNEHNKINFKLFYTMFSTSLHNKDLDTDDIEYYRDYVFPAIDKSDAQPLSYVFVCVPGGSRHQGYYTPSRTNVKPFILLF